MSVAPIGQELIGRVARVGELTPGDAVNLPVHLAKESESRLDLERAEQLAHFPRPLPRADGDVGRRAEAEQELRIVERGQVADAPLGALATR